MRGLGFRAYIKPLKRYATGLDIIQFHKCCDVAGVGIWTVVTVNEGIFEGDDIIIEQSTGLKDKNGKEIYEGDIVKARWYRAKNARLDTEGEIKFGDGWFYIKDDPDGEDRLGVPIHNCYDIKIVGNIHEREEGK